VGHDERGPVELGDRRRHRHRLAGAGGAEQGLEALAGAHASASEAIAAGWSAVGL
jgi:hypothetical protein